MSADAEERNVVVIVAFDNVLELNVESFHVLDQCFAETIAEP